MKQGIASDKSSLRISPRPYYDAAARCGFNTTSLSAESAIVHTAGKVHSFDRHADHGGALFVELAEPLHFGCPISPLTKIFGLLTDAKRAYGMARAARPGECRCEPAPGH